MGKQFQVKPADAMELEELEQREHRRRRTELAIKNTYREKSPTAKRRKLPNGRKWKNKTKQYAGVIGKITMERFNDNQKRERIIQKVFKYNKGASPADAMVRGGGM